MERIEYKYNTMFSKETNESMKLFHEIREDCRLILKAEKHIEWVTGEKSPEPSDDTMNEFNEYLKRYLDEEDRGTLRTLLVVGKPYKHNPIVKDTLETLADKLRKDSPSGFI